MIATLVEITAPVLLKAYLQYLIFLFNVIERVLLFS